MLNRARRVASVAAVSLLFTGVAVVHSTTPALAAASSVVAVALT
jgi:hypothetical protein